MATVPFPLWLVTQVCNDINELEEEGNSFGEAVVGGNLSNNILVENRWDTCSAQQLKKSLFCDSHSSAIKWGEHSALSNKNCKNREMKHPLTQNKQLLLPLLTED